MKFKKPKVNKTPKKAIDHLARIAKEMSGPGTVKVGLPKGSNAYPDGTSIIMVGTVHEFGSPSRGVPERSYLRSTLEANRRTYKAFIFKLGLNVVKGKITAEKALRTLGLKVESDVKGKITDLKDPAVARGGNPLIDTGHLRQVITHVVGE